MQPPVGAVYYADQRGPCLAKGGGRVGVGHPRYLAGAGGVRVGAASRIVLAVGSSGQMQSVFGASITHFGVASLLLALGSMIPLSL